MGRLCHLVALAAALLVAGVPAQVHGDGEAAPALQALIVTGQNNHDWRATTPVLRDILERSGRFTVAVTEHPETATAPDFAPYHVIVSNYNGPRWGAVAEQALLDFVRAGKGFVVIHAANNAFTDWPEYVALIGGFWGGQAGHGRRHPFTVRIADRTHPITAGMADFLHSTDELYHRLEMQPHIHLLATAFSDPETAGTGRDEPIAWTVDYQGGRCFHLVLGHDVEGMSGAGFAALVQRGTEWAATGRVSPEVEALTLLPQMAAEDGQARYRARTRLIGLGAEAVGPLMEAAAGEDTAAAEAREALLWIAQRWAGSPQGAQVMRAALEYAAPGRPVETRALAARMLGLMGDAQAAAGLKAIADDAAAMREEARRALMQVGGAEATQALIEMLADAPPEFGIVLLRALAARGDRAATPAIMQAASAGNMGVRVAAVEALGRLGDPRAEEGLWSLLTRGPAELRIPAVDSYLRLAESLVARGQVYRGVTMYRRAVGLPLPERFLVAAVIGLGRAGRPQVVRDIAPFLGAASPQARTAAATALAAIPGPEATRALVAGLGRAPAATRVTILGQLGERGDPEAIPAALAALGDADPEVRMAAAGALGRMGDAAADAPMRRLIEREAEPARSVALTAYLDLADRLRRQGDAVTGAAYSFALRFAESPGLRARALRGVGATGRLEDQAAVEAVLGSEDARLAEAALDACIALGDAAAAHGAREQAQVIYRRALDHSPTYRMLVIARRLQAVGAEVDLAALQGFVTNWWVIGPFPSPNKQAWDRAYPPEQEIALERTYEIDGRTLAWRSYHAEGPQGIVLLDRLLSPTEDQAAYLFARVMTMQEQPVRFLVGSDDGVKVWLNGQEVWANNADRGLSVDQDQFEAVLRQGENALLLKVLNGGGDWAAVVRITDAQGHPLRQ